MAQVVILNGNPDAVNDGLDRYLSELGDRLERKGHIALPYRLRDMDIRYCNGCWGCWVKTPGECVIRDDTQSLRDAAVNADLVVYASPVKMGFVSALLKQAMDRMIPLVHPYITFVAGESHHRRRYDRYPPLGLVLEKTPGTDDEDVGIIADTFRRFGLNFHGRLAFAYTTGDPVAEVVREVDGL